MFVNEVSDVKIYNLSAGKSVPEVSSPVDLGLEELLTSITHFPFLLVAYRSTQEIPVDEKGGLSPSDRTDTGF